MFYGLVDAALLGFQSLFIENISGNNEQQTIRGLDAWQETELIAEIGSRILFSYCLILQRLLIQKPKSSFSSLFWKEVIN